MYKVYGFMANGHQKLLGSFSTEDEAESFIRQLKNANQPWDDYQYYFG